MVNELELVLGMTVYVFLLVFSLDTESYIADRSPPRTRSDSEMISYWV